MKQKIRDGTIALQFLEQIEDGAIRILELVQENQWFFGNPLAGSDVMKIAADKLEELIKDAEGKW